MRTIAIIGSGIAGLLTAHGLMRAGQRVTLLSDRTADHRRDLHPRASPRPHQVLKRK